MFGHDFPRTTLIRKKMLLCLPKCGGLAEKDIKFYIMQKAPVIQICAAN